jgi:hypothetical protein
MRPVEIMALLAIVGILQVITDPPRHREEIGDSDEDDGPASNREDGDDDGAEKRKKPSDGDDDEGEQEGDGNEDDRGKTKERDAR